MNAEKYWLCWSPRQNAFHIESETNGLNRNRQSFDYNRKPDFQPIGIFPTAKDANTEAERLTPIIRKRDKNRRFRL